MNDESPAPPTIYQFGDSEPAAERLRRLAAVFEPTSRDLLRRLQCQRVDTIADLGCGPGYTTRMLADVFPAARVTGFDISTNFVERARREAGDRVRFAVADITQPLPGAPFDLLYCRYVLTHLAEPLESARQFAAQLTPRGVLVIEENQWIETRQPTFARYLAIAAALLDSANQRLYVGAELAAANWHGLSAAISEVMPLAVTARAAAGMFVLNLATWRTRPFILQNYAQAEFDQMQAELERLVEDASDQPAITFGVRQLALTPSPRPVDTASGGRND